MGRMALTNEAIGMRLRQWRLSRSLSQLAIAQPLGLHREAISEVEAGKRRLTFLEAFEIHDKLGMPWTALTDSRYVQRLP